MLRFLDSQYPVIVEYKELEKATEAINCSPQKLARVLAYLKEKGFIEGYVDDFSDLLPEWITLRINARGIDHLEELKENIRLKVEETEKEVGFKFYSRKQEKKDT